MSLPLEELRTYHTDRREMNVAVTCEKSPVPLLWVDTSVYMDLAKMDNGENIEKMRATKLSRLRQVVRKAVREERLVCPRWDQKEEYEGKRLQDEIRRVAADLGCGATGLAQIGVKDREINIALHAYRDKATALEIPAKIFFSRDPIQDVRVTLDSKFIVDVAAEKPAELLAKSEADKKITWQKMESLRKEQRRQKKSFDEQLGLERIGESDVMIEMVDDFHRKASVGQADFWSYMGMWGYSSYHYLWLAMKGPGPAIGAIYSFMRSPYYWELPTQDISCRLFADLLVRECEVKIGDSRDVSHLSTAIPVAHFVVTDKAMVDRCERLGIDRKWKTKLYKTKTLDRLCDELESLPTKA
jgi:hypothetical protein